MPTNVVMPQMGESIAEGTVVRWIKKLGDQVDRDEPLFEISTDKVDAEIPSPAAGVLSDIRVKEGETVPVNSVVAVIGNAGEAADAKSAVSEQVSPERSRSFERIPSSSLLSRLFRARTKRTRTGPTETHAMSCGARSRRRSCAGLPGSTTSTSSS